MMKVYAALRDDVSEGHVWLDKPGLRARCIVRITNADNGRTVYCESLQFEKNFLAEYNDPQGRRVRIDNAASAIVMSSWYRAQLGTPETQKDYPLAVTAALPLWGQLRAATQHPQAVVRFAVWIGLWSVALGIIGIVLSLRPKC